MQQDPQILEQISTAIIALDGELRVISLNGPCQDLLESSHERSVGLPVWRLVARPEELQHALQQVARDRSPLARRSMPLTLLSGRNIHIDLIVTPVTGMDCNASLLLELQSVDRLLMISRKENLTNTQESTREMILGLAHEIKNPLGGVRGAAQLLARELPSDELREYTDIIIREADRLRDLVDRLLGPNQELNRTDLNVHEILEHVRNLISAETNNVITVIRDYDPSLPDIFGDRSQLIQALLNIVRNALQAAPAPAGCRLTLRTRPQRQFTIGSTRHRLLCRVDIEDNGPGIAEDILPNIFMPMVTGRAQGTGLGLTISQAIVTRHGGQLECASEPGCTRFTLYLPMETSHA